MIKWIKSKFANGIWSGLAMIIVLLLAGPEIAISMELYAMVEVLGASTFVLAYIAGLKSMLLKPYQSLQGFEQYSNFFVPKFAAVKQMPSLLVHAIPERVSTLILSACMLAGMLFAYSSTYLIS